MSKTNTLMKPRERERGVVLIVILIIASIFAVLAYTALAVSINSLDTADTHKNIFTTRQIAEGAVHEGAYGLLTDPRYINPKYIDPSVALSVSENTLKSQLISNDYSTPVEVETFPSIFQRLAYTTHSEVSTYYPDTDVISGNSDDATYRYLDDETFSQNYPGFEYAKTKSEGYLHVYGVGELKEPEGDTNIFSFVKGSYPNIQYNYHVREAGITEPSRIGPYPLIETQHSPYGKNQSRAWSITYQQDPAHPGRTINDIRLMAATNEVQIDDGDWLYISGWLETEKRFQNLGEIPPVHRLTNYVNSTNEVFTTSLNTTTLGLFFRSDGVDPPAGKDFGFRVSGIRYKFDSDQYACYYETPHPYEKVIQQSTQNNLHVQVIYSPFQADPTNPSIGFQSMTIQFDDRFSLDTGDRLYLFNASVPTPAAPVATYTSVSPPPPGGYAPIIMRIDTELPLGYILMLVRPTGGDNDGINNYGYKVIGLEYSDERNKWMRIDNPTIQTPHNANLGAIAKNIIPVGIFPFPVPIGGWNLAGYQTIYRPAVPNTDDPNGLGTTDEWFVAFSDACDLSATSGITNMDRIRVTTPGNPLVSNGASISDEIYFVHPNGGYGFLIGTDFRYFDIADMKGWIAECGNAEFLQIEFTADNTDSYENSFKNFGYQVTQVGYTTSNGCDDDDTPPTVRSDMNYPFNKSYPAFGDGPLETAEWWYENPNAKVVGLHFDRYQFDLDPGDRLEIYDEYGTLIATILSDAVVGGPEAGGPVNPNQPMGGQQPGHGPKASGPYIPSGVSPETLVDLNATFGWVLVPGTTALIRLVGDGDKNEGYSGFEIDHCGFVNGDITEIREYVMEYARLAYDKYYDRTAEPIERFRSLGL